MAFTPGFAWAQAIQKDLSTLRGIADYVVRLITVLVIPLLITVALAWFIWGVAEFIRAADNAEERKKGKNKMVWGIVALFFMIAFLGVTAIFTNSLFGGNPGLPILPTN